jgi:surface antigen
MALPFAMWTKFKTLMACTLIFASPAQALNEGLQCVPYARAISGIQIRGDAHSWWEKAAGQYERGGRPIVGAVMAFRPHGSMRLGHVAAVRRIVDKRTVLVSHANWSTINGTRGHIENDVAVVDASEANDWSRVKVWYAPNSALGTTEWPLNGFIYPAKAQSWSDARQAVAILLGGARPVPTGSMAQSPATLAKSSPAFRLSWGLKNDIDKTAKAEVGARR